MSRSRNSRRGRRKSQRMSPKSELFGPAKPRDAYKRDRRAENKEQADAE